MSQRYFTEQQPKDGQTVLHCEHIPEGKNGHFYALGEGVAFTRPDGGKDIAHWIVICDACREVHDKSPIDAVTGDSRWIGDAPAIKADAQ